MQEKTTNNSSIWRRLGPALGFMLALVVLMVFFYDTESKQPITAAQNTAKARYYVAKDVFEKLKQKDDVSRKQWDSLAKEFYAIYDEYENWPNRPAALFRSAAVLQALAQSTGDDDDYVTAINCYIKLANEFKQSRLADDALLQAALLQSKQLKNDDKALQLLKYIRTSLPKGDMYSSAITFEKSLNSKIQASKKRPAVAKVALTQVTWSTLDKNTVQITVALNKNTTWRIAKGKANQLLLTMDNTTPDKGVHDGARVKNSVLKQLAVLRQNKGNTALKFDFENLSNYQTRIEKNPFRIVLTATAKVIKEEKQSQLALVNKAQAKPKAAVPAKPQSVAKAEPKAKPIAKKAEVKAKPAVQKTEPKAVATNTKKAKPQTQSKTVKPVVKQADKPATKTTVKPVVKTASQKVQVASKEPTAKELSRRVHKANTDNMAMQLGLNLQTVYIDVGHGGRDPGAIGNGIVERDIVLDTSLRLGKILKAHGLNVVYSRSNDVTVPLSSRPARANNSAADIFVSIHINANEDRRIHGFETYFLNFAKNSQAAQTAALENATSDRKLGDMQSLLAKMMLNVRTTESSDLAGDVQSATMAKLKNNGFNTRNGGTRSAPFHVLIGTNMPAILVELGYCSNKDEASKLKQAKYRNILAQGIADGILSYKKRFERVKGMHFALTSNNDDAM